MIKTWSKFFFFLSAFCLIIMTGARFILGAWPAVLYIFLVLFILGIIALVVLNYRAFFTILSIKTSKSGLSVGWSVCRILIFLITISYLGNHFNKSWDLTEEGINSLSEQSQKVVKDLDSNLEFLIFYKGDKISPESMSIKRELKSDLSIYKRNNPKVKIHFIDAYIDHLKSNKYLAQLPDKNRQEIFVFVKYQDRIVRVLAPFLENNLTSAIIKSKKRRFTNILFLTNHREKDLENETPDGLKIFKHALIDSGYNIKTWNFLQQGPPSKNPSLIISIGPSQAFLKKETLWLSRYLKSGGKLLLSLDPQENHQLAPWLKNYGIIFENNFIFSQLGRYAIGTIFDKNNLITKRFYGQRRTPLVLFERASALKVSNDFSKKFHISHLVKSDKKSFSVPKLSNKITRGPLQSFTMAVDVRYKQTKKSSKNSANTSRKNSFQLIVFGDSDFVTNRYIDQGFNKDLILNSLASLANEKELISIRPKRPKGTKVSLNYPRTFFIFLYVSLPIFFLLMGLFLWYKKRES